MFRPILRCVGLCALALPACASPSVTGDVKGEPVCPDFQLGGANGLMKGSLRKPVQLSIVEDDEVRWQRVLLGRRRADDPVSKFVVEDDDDSYLVRWAQCANTFAPKRDDDAKGPPQPGSSFNCGDATVYKELELKVVQGDPASRVIEWQPPPDPSCWTGTDPSAATSASAAASAVPEASAAPDASASASASPSGSAAGSAGSSKPPPSGQPAPPASPR